MEPFHPEFGEFAQAIRNVIQTLGSFDSELKTILAEKLHITGEPENRIPAEQRYTDGGLACTQILNTSSNGLNKILTVQDSNNNVVSLQTGTTIINGNTTSETITSYASGAVSATGQLTAAGVAGALRIDSTTTSATAAGGGRTISIQRDQTGGGWVPHSETGLFSDDEASSLSVSGFRAGGFARTCFVGDPPWQAHQRN